VDTACFKFKICSLLLLLCALLSRPFGAFAQLPGMRKYTLIDGYTATNGYVIQQDQKGFIWLGTENGALRFDGKKFQVLRDKLRPADQEILSCNPYGKDQVLLVPLLNNITYYKNGEIISSQKDPGLNLVRNTGKNSAFFDAFTGNIWLCDENRIKTLYCFSANDIRKINVPDTSLSIIAVRNNKVIGSDRETGLLKQYDLALRQFKPIYNSSLQQIFCTGAVEAKEDGKYIFMFNKPGETLDIYTFSNDSTLNHVKTIRQLPTSRSRMVFTDKELNLWFRFPGGSVAHLNKEQNNQPPSLLFRFLDKAVINYLLVDREKNIWMSAQNNSLYFLSYKHFRNALNVNAILPGTAVPKFINGDAQGNIGIGYVNKTAFSIWKNGRIKNYTLSQDFYEGVRCICPLGNNRFLIMDKDLALVDGNKGSIRYFHSISSYKDMSLYSDGGLLVANQSNAFYLKPEDVARATFKGTPQTIFEGRTSAIASLADGTVLIGTPDGLFIKKNLYANAIRINHPVLSSISITDIADKGRSGALISTNAQGIYYFDSKNGKVEAIKVFQETDAGLVRRIFKQNDNLYWLATEKGACEVLFDKDSKVKHVRNYTFYDGLPSNNITSVYVYKDTAFITTAEGPGIIPLLDTTLLQMNAPLVYLNAVQLRDTILLRPGGSMELSYRQHDFLISLSAISYESFGNIKYYYQMEGMSDEWIETDNPEIRFAGLAPGTYLFKAYASNAKGVRSKVPVMLSIRILPAFWQTLFFKAAVCLLVVLLLYFILRRRALRLASGKYEKARQERRLAELELEAIKAQINPHFIYNCLNSIQYFNYEKQHDQARQYLDLFARLIRLTMQYSRQAFITIAEETDYLGNYLQLEKMRFHERLHYQVIVADNIDQQLMIPAMLIQPYVENALKHGIAARKEGGNVVISFHQPEENLLMISVEDDGVGFNPGHNGNKSSMGLRLSGSRAETYNQLFGMKIDISFQNKNSFHPDKSGIIVQLKIPIISYEHALL
jgi:hypothetical protein